MDNITKIFSLGCGILGVLANTVTATQGWENKALQIGCTGLFVAMNLRTIYRVYLYGREEMRRQIMGGRARKTFMERLEEGFHERLWVGQR